ncbi:MAG: pseudouridine synthase [Candidatus Bathyarchaeota archaeon]|nr:pseudouridine synthase [Candidatus Bathyarchaeota archaeon]MDW8039800.1 PUA domain-containing protein [Nitrososphaerota archaeon]
MSNNVLTGTVPDLDNPLRRIRSMADYQFGRGVGEKLFPENVEVAYSKRTGRIRYVYLDGKRLVTLRPMDGLFSLSIEGAKRIVENQIPAKCLVVVQNEVSKFIADGGDVFAIHVVKADSEILPKDEVIVVNEKGEVLAVGRAVLSGEEMTAFKVGVAVKVRRGVLEES